MRSTFVFALLLTWFFDAMAWDARGAQSPSIPSAATEERSSAEAALEISVDPAHAEGVENQDARRPVGNAAWAQAARLTASDGRKSDELGYSVAVSGNTIVVGAPYATVNSHYAQGAAYVFVKSGSGWGHLIQKAKLTASDGASNAFFGSSVAISGDTVVIGADGVNLGSKQYAGAAYVFVKPQAAWTNMTQTAKLTASDAASTAYFGSSVSISGDTVAVGADGAEIGSNKFQGAVYVFTKPATSWATTSSFSAKLTVSDGAKGDQLGYSVSVSGDTVVAGARSATVGPNSRQGAVYVFAKPAKGWANGQETARLTASDGAKGDQLGYSVSISGTTVAAGAPAPGSPGAVYVFVKPTDGWPRTAAFPAKLAASAGATGDQLGYSVSISGDTVAAGARSATIGSNSRQGAVYLFAKPASGWASVTPTAKLTSTTGGRDDGLGSSVSISAEAIVAGAFNASIASNKYQGAVYVFSTGLSDKPATPAPRK